MFSPLAQTLSAFIFTVLIVKHLIALIGQSTLLNYAWYVYTIVASKAGHPKFVKLAQMRADLLKINKERKAISAQDQYAKWTKLNRQFDKLSTDIAAMADEVSSEKTNVTKITNLAIMAVTTAPIWYSRFFFRKMVMFYFPPGVLPSAMEWCLALPFSKTGGIGLTVWMFAINSVLTSFEFLVKFLIEPAVEKPTKTEKIQEVEQEKTQASN